MIGQTNQIFNPDTLLLADLHLHERKEFGVMDGEISSRLKEGLSIIEQIGGLVDKHNISEVIVLGDIFELKDRVPNHVLVAFAESLHKIHSPIKVLLGNHDFKVKRYSSLKLFSLGDLFTLIDRPTYMKLSNGLRVGFLPFFREYTDFEFFWERLHNQSEFDLFCFHQAIPGVVYKSKNKIPGTFNLTMFRDTLYLAGHIHQHCQVGDKIMYLGSPYQVNFNEVGDKKYVWLLDSKIMKLRPVELDYPRFVTTNINEEVTDSVTGNYVKLIGEITPDKKPMVVQKREEVMSLGAKGVVTDIHYMREVKKRLDAKTSTENIIKDYVKQASKSLTRHLQKDKLVALGESLLQEARSL